MSLQSDADAFYDGKKPAGKESAQTNQSTVTSQKTSVENKSWPFVTDGPTQETTERSQPPPQSQPAHSQNFQPKTEVEIQAESERRGTAKHIKNRFNIRAARITSATLGDMQNVDINTTRQVYKPGASKEEISIKDGTFLQSTIGGKSVYNNQNASITAMKGGVPALDGPGTMDIPDNPPYTPEQVVLKLLKTGVSRTELIDLLEKKYTVTNLAYALPKTTRKRNAMVDALLRAAFEEESMDVDSNQ